MKNLFFTALLCMASMLSAAEITAVPESWRGLYTIVAVGNGGDGESVTTERMETGHGEIRIAGLFVVISGERFELGSVYENDGVVTASIQGGTEVIVLGYMVNVEGNPLGIMALDVNDGSWVAMQIERAE